MTVTMMSTKLTKGGQTTVPKEVRSALGIADGARVYWTFDGTRAWVSAEPARALEVAGEAEFMARIAEAESAAASGRVRPAEGLSAGLRERYGVA